MIARFIRRATCSMEHEKNIRLFYNYPGRPQKIKDGGVVFLMKKSMLEIIIHVNDYP
jgi:hypothetical protein